MSTISEYAILAQLAIAMPIGSVENERVFSTMNYIKSSVRNRLGSAHLNVAVRMFTQPLFTLATFPYRRAYNAWLDASSRGRYGLSAPEEVTEADL